MSYISCCMILCGVIFCLGSVTVLIFYMRRHLSALVLVLDVHVGNPTHETTVK